MSTSDAPPPEPTAAHEDLVREQREDAAVVERIVRSIDELHAAYLDPADPRHENARVLVPQLLRLLEELSAS